MENALELLNLCYRYRHAESLTLKNINLDLERGKFVVVMGPAGAGKSTLSLCLNGLIPQLLEGELSGRLTVAGQDVSRQPVQALARHIGLVLQDPETQIFGRTVAEDTAFGPRNLAFSEMEVERRVAEVLKLVALQGYDQRNTAELSGGEKQRLAVAGVLAMGPEILVLDEPASELDPQGRVDLYAALDELRRKRNLTILVIEHNVEEVIERADEVVVLNEGEIVWRGLPADLFRQVELLRQLGIKPLPVSELGWDFYQRGWIESEEVPLNLSAAANVVRKIVMGRSESPEPAIVLTVPAEQVLAQAIPDRPVIAQTPVLLTVSGLVHRYPSGQTVIKDLDLSVREGEFVALVGPNGAGKTTLAKHFNGLLKPSDGDVIVDGINTRHIETAGLAQTVGYVFQNPDHQIFAVSVEKEIEYGLRNVGLGHQEIRNRLDWVLDLTGLQEHRTDHPFTLGKGKRQLLATASILALKPKLLVIDEPTTGLDWNGTQAIMSFIRELNRHGTTIVMITHDMEIVARHARRVIVMNQGRILSDAEPRSLFTNSSVMQEAALVPPQIARLSQDLTNLELGRTYLTVEEFINAGVCGR
ncbi:energy-coupling factor transporter ATPase [Paradesulfitobacterium aromaticivorans]